MSFQLQWPARNVFFLFGYVCASRRVLSGSDIRDDILRCLPFDCVFLMGFDIWRPAFAAAEDPFEVKNLCGLCSI